MKLVAALFLALLPLSLYVWELTAPIRGDLSARIDLFFGVHQLLGYGLPAPWSNEWRQALRERYSIEHRAIAGCAITRRLTDYAKAYNAVMRDAATRSYGRDVIGETAEEVRSRWQKERLQRRPHDR